MMVEGSVAKYLSHMQNRKPAAAHKFMCTLFQFLFEIDIEIPISQEFIV